MGRTIEIKAADGHRFNIYEVHAADADQDGALGTIIIAPEIFGVNSHIRQVADEYAAAGFSVIAPHLFDRAETHYEAGYDQTDVAAGIAIIGNIGFDESLKDLAACVAYAGDGPVAVVGYCWGGTIAWLAAARLPGLSAAVAYYGGGIADLATEQPQVPVMLHFAEQDTHPTLEQAREVAARHPDAETFYYPAGHGFNCDQRGSFHQASATEARDRTSQFLKRIMAA